MNFEDFKRLLDTNPYSKDPQFLEAKKNDPICCAAYKKAMKQEKLLLEAINIPVPELQKSAIIFSQNFSNDKISKKQYWSLAATVFVITTISLLFFGPRPTSDLEDFINEALILEPAVYMSEDEIPYQELQPLFTSLGAQANEQLGNIHFMKLCSTLDGTGARMVFMNDYSQPITVLYMPNSPIEKSIQLQMKGYKGKVIALDKGSAAIIARPYEETAKIEASLKKNLQRLN